MLFAGLIVLLGFEQFLLKLLIEPLDRCHVDSLHDQFDAGHLQGHLLLRLELKQVQLAIVELFELGLDLVGQLEVIFVQSI